MVDLPENTWQQPVFIPSDGVENQQFSSNHFAAVSMT
jgi:hypothetical protein